MLQNATLAQHILGRGPDDGRRLLRVDHRGDNRHCLHRCLAAIGAGRVGRHFQDTPVDHAVGWGVVAANGALENGPLGDDVERRPGVERADGDDNAVVRVSVAADDALQGDDDLRRGQDGVGAEVRGRAVAAAPLDGDGEDAGRRHRRPLDNTRLAQRYGRPQMHGQSHVRPRMLQHPLGDDRQRPAQPLLGRLEEELERAGYLVLPSREEPRQRQPHGHMAIVAAGVHDAGVDGSIVVVALLLNGQRVHVETQQDSGTGPRPFQQSHDARVADAGLHFQAQAD